MNMIFNKLGFEMQVTKNHILEPDIYINVNGASLLDLNAIVDEMPIFGDMEKVDNDWYLVLKSDMIKSIKHSKEFGVKWF